MIIFLLLTGSCTSRKSSLDKKNLIPEKELVPLLTDIYLGTGLLNLPKINFWASNLDSISTYYQIIEKHGFTKDAVDKTMKYYFLKKPKELNKIYDQILGILSEMESRVEKEFLLDQARSMNLWRGKDFYPFPSISGDDSTNFDLTLFNKGYYTVSFTVTLYPDDQSVNPRPSMYSCSQDSLETGNRQYINSIEFIKDGRPHKYSIVVNGSEKSVRHLIGWLYDCENRTNKFEKHSIIENISISFNHAAL